MPLEIPPALPPGTTEETRSTKFSGWNGVSGYYQRSATSMQPYYTDNMKSQVYKKDLLRSSSEICAKMRVANKSQVVKTKRVEADESVRPINFRRSVSHEQHVDFATINGTVTSTIGGGEDFRDAFFAVANNTNDDPYITMQDVPNVVMAGCGDGAPKFIMDKFMILCKRAEVGERVYWADFVRLVPRAIAAASADCSLKREEAPLVTLMNKPRINDPNLGPMHTHKSAYVDTFCISNNELLRKGVTKTKDNTPHSILNIAAKDLALGTSKGTLQIPGYSGHMPLNLATERKKAHSYGEHLHPVVNSLRMTKKGGNNVLGYAAHTPWHAASDKERVCGTDPRTSTGAAFGPVRLII